jgi:hypothetical protein
VEKAVLVGKVVAERRFDLDRAGQDGRQAHTDGGHQALTPEARLNPGFEVWVSWLDRCRHLPIICGADRSMSVMLLTAEDYDRSR